MASKEEMIGGCAGIDKDGKPVTCSVMKKGKTIRLTDFQGFNHTVHPSNEGSAEGWAREFGLCRNVSGAKHFPQVIRDVAEKRHLDELKRNFDEEKAKKAAVKDQN